MKRTLVSLGLILALISMGTLIPSRTHASTLTTATAAAVPPGAIQIPINFASPNGNFTGVFSLSRFVLQNGQVAAVGTLTGTVTNAAGQTVGAIVQNLTLSLININATCDILHLELGPIDLNLLGLVVHVDKIVIDIDAQSGPGNLLGNLLCAVANLLNANGPLSQLVNLLNQILALL
jgi:hypothetical protein